jgi:heterodisulfide reductase subunit A-like polyferredoxin
VEAPDAFNAGLTKRKAVYLPVSHNIPNRYVIDEKNPEMDVFILYRNIMAYGFLESFYTRARREGVLFIQYSPERKPVAAVEDGVLKLSAHDPILGREIALARKNFIHSQKVLDEYEGDKVPEPAAYIEKPPDADELLTEVKKILP